MRKLIGFLTVVLAVLLASCGGGGGSAGDTGPTNQLRMLPSLSGVTMGVGYYADVAKVTGGVKPYYIGSSAPGVEATLLDDGTIRVVTHAPGEGEVWVQDSSIPQAKVSFPMKSVVAELRSSVGGTVSLQPNQSQSFTVSGGGQPYTAVSSDPSVATVNAGANGTFTITAGSKLGTATILVTDAYGATLTITVTNSFASAFVVAPATLAGVAGGSGSVSVSGGLPPYTAVSSNPSVAAASLSGSVVTVGYVSAGTASIVLRDATGASATVGVTVTAPPPPAPAFIAIPPVQNLAETTTPARPAEVTFTLLNGEGPYYATIPTAQQSLIESEVAVVPAGGTEMVFRRVDGACVTAPTSIPITITDASSGKTASVTIVMQDNDPSCPAP